MLAPKFSKDDIVNQFESNYDLFGSAINELLEYENVYFRNDNNIIYAKVRYEQDDQVIINKMSQEQLSKCKKTIKLIKKLNLENISKDEDNITFLFHSSLKNSQYIIYVIDEDKFFEKHDISHYEKIKDKWFYLLEID